MLLNNLAGAVATLQNCAAATSRRAVPSALCVPVAMPTAVTWTCIAPFQTALRCAIALPDSLLLPAACLADQGNPIYLLRQPFAPCRTLVHLLQDQMQSLGGKPVFKRFGGEAGGRHSSSPAPPCLAGCLVPACGQ